MDKKHMEEKIKELLGQKLEAGELEFLHGFYKIPNLYNYSLFNSILIMLQGGTIVSGFNGWKKLGRYVKKGEHARIKILVPLLRKIKEEEKESTECFGFIDRKVFDISQTDGKPLKYKNNSVEKIEYSFDVLRDKLSKVFNLSISTGMTGNARGYFNRLDNSIKISSLSHDNDKCKTLFHELGHALMHKDMESNILNSDDSHSAKEVEAELVSLLTCASLGVTFKESELYIKHYNQNRPQINVFKVIGTVQKILKEVLS